jgi:hypothetical protein
MPRALHDSSVFAVRPIIKLHKGGPKQTNAAGIDLVDHFRATANDPAIVAMFNKLHGEKPNYIPIHLPFDDPKAVYDPKYRKFNQSGLMESECDGIQVTKRMNESGRIENVTDVACQRNRTTGICPTCSAYATNKKNGIRFQVPVKTSGSFYFIIDKLVLEGVYGIAAIETSSAYDENYLLSRLDEIKLQFGNLTQIPLVLCRKPVNIRSNFTSDGNTYSSKRIEHSLIHIEINPEYVKQKATALTSNSTSNAAAMIEAPKLETSIECDSLVDAVNLANEIENGIIEKDSTKDNANILLSRMKALQKTTNATLHDWQNLAHDCNQYIEDNGLNTKKISPSEMGELKLLRVTVQTKINLFQVS